MAVRLAPALVRGRAVDLAAWRGQQLAGLPVGRHDECGAPVYAVETSRSRGVWWLTVRCRCGHEAALPAAAGEQLRAAA